MVTSAPSSASPLINLVRKVSAGQERPAHRILIGRLLIRKIGYLSYDSSPDHLPGKPKVLLLISHLESLATALQPGGKSEQHRDCISSTFILRRGKKNKEIINKC